MNAFCYPIKRMISVVNDDAEFDKRSDKIEEKARVSTDEAIGSRNEDNKLSLGVSDEEARVSPMEHDLKDFLVLENNRSGFMGLKWVYGLGKGEISSLVTWAYI
ncbi:Tudor/PWWP/MBT superfamily protein [Gossypium australe]|uniref:Tudor/PWWP/MBT superfamily protein n=1 Tax=Gossypium australe TaxID=47621 RepID=A0A5B6X5Y4_9ROSI|nr:Tudor/PWWP/MBT superfamily protein [Gossypium australe]